MIGEDLPLADHDHPGQRRGDIDQPPDYPRTNGIAALLGCNSPAPVGLSSAIPWSTGAVAGQSSPRDHGRGHPLKATDESPPDLPYKSPSKSDRRGQFSLTSQDQYSRVVDRRADGREPKDKLLMCNQWCGPFRTPLLYPVDQPVAFQSQSDRGRIRTRTTR